MTVVLANPRITKVSINPNNGKVMSLSGVNATQGEIERLNLREEPAPSPATIQAPTEAVKFDRNMETQPQPEVQRTATVDLNVITQFKNMYDALPEDQKAMVRMLIGV